MKPTHTSVYNIDATNMVPDEVLYDLHLYLGEHCYGNALCRSVKIDDFPMWGQNIKVDPDFLNQTVDALILRKLALIMLNFIPIVSTNNENLDIVGNGDSLGCYWHCMGPQHYSGKPHIEIYTDKIFNACKGNKDDYKRITLYVLIHELAHAIMDVNNYGLQDNYSTVYRKIINQSYNFYKMREESFANLLSYEIMWGERSDDFCRSLLNKYPREKLIDFFKNQPFEYKLANVLIDSEDRACSFFKWMDFKSNNQINMRNAQEWLRAVMIDPNNAREISWF